MFQTRMFTLITLGSAGNTNIKFETSQIEYYIFPVAKRAMCRNRFVASDFILYVFHKSLIVCFSIARLARVSFRNNVQHRYVLSSASNTNSFLSLESSYEIMLNTNRLSSSVNKLTSSVGVSQVSRNNSEQIG